LFSCCSFAALIHISTDFHSNGSATKRERGTEAPEI
jgi:hypothetical protein